MFPRTANSIVSVVVVLFFAPPPAGRALPEPPPVSFRAEIAPLLLAQCQGCHGAEEAKGDFRVDRYTELMRALEGEPPRVRAGQPSASLMLQLLRSEDADDRMPQRSARSRPGKLSWSGAGSRRGHRSTALTRTRRWYG